jgi:hypothetical protein
MRLVFVRHTHTLIKVYGFEGEPYKLPVFLTPRIFSLEYIRQRMTTDHLHFTQHKQSVTFKLPHEVGPFLVKLITSLSFVEGMLQQFFEKEKSWIYDPQGIIVARKPMLYKHQLDPIIESTANLDTWEEVKHILMAQVENSSMDRSYSTRELETSQKIEVLLGKRGSPYTKNEMDIDEPLRKKSKKEEELIYMISRHILLIKVKVSYSWLKFQWIRFCFYCKTSSSPFYYTTLSFSSIVSRS